MELVFADQLFHDTKQKKAMHDHKQLILAKMVAFLRAFVGKAKKTEVRLRRWNISGESAFLSYPKNFL